MDLDNKNALCVVIKDSNGYLDTVEEVSTLSTNITSASDRERGDTVFRVALPKNSLFEVPVATYLCNPQLRPIPMVSKYHGSFFMAFTVTLTIDSFATAPNVLTRSWSKVGFRFRTMSAE